MAEEDFKTYATIYAELEATDRKSAELLAHVPIDRNLRAHVQGDPGRMATPIPLSDPGRFKEALDELMPPVQAAFKRAQTDGDFDEADRIESVLTRLYFWRIYARDKLIAALDARGTETAMNALRTAASHLEATRKAFDQGDHDTDTAMTSLDELVEALGLK